MDAAASDSLGPKTGPAADALIAQILERRRHPQQGFRSCLGILRLGKRYGDARLDAACVRALRIGAASFKSVESILKHKLDLAAAAKRDEAHLTPSGEYANHPAAGFLSAAGRSSRVIDDPNCSQSVGLKM